MTNPEIASPARIASGQAASDPWPQSPARAYSLLACIVSAYVGVYLCRKNISVAIPMLQTAFHATKAETGKIISCSAAAYAVGKFAFGPLIDRVGGRKCLLFVLAGVAICGGLGGMAASLPMLVGCYTANRFCGAAGWGSIVKLAPAWFPARRMSLALAFLSLSFVFGGVCALTLAGEIAGWTNNNWRAVMGLPSLALVVLFVICWIFVPKDAPAARVPGSSTFDWSVVRKLAGNPQLWVVCAIAFTLYIMRETFNDWTVDFFKTEGGAQMSIKAAALLSTPFDAAGAAGIVALGWAFDGLGHRWRIATLVVSLTMLAVLINYLPAIFHLGTWQVETAIALIGFLSYGPYSLLAGIFAVEIGGKQGVSTVAGIVDSAGYLGTVFAGQQFGRLLDLGGYRLGFHALAIVTFVSALLCLGLKTRSASGYDRAR